MSTVTKAFPVIEVDPCRYSKDDVRLLIAPFTAASMVPFRGEYVLVRDLDSAAQGTGRVHHVSYVTREIYLDVVWERSYV